MLLSNFKFLICILVVYTKISRVESESFTVQTVNDSDSTLDDIFASVNVKYADSKLEDDLGVVLF